MKQKPEIGFNRVSEEFTITTGTARRPSHRVIDYHEARERWDACDADWTMAAYKAMSESLNHVNPLAIGGLYNLAAMLPQP